MTLSIEDKRLELQEKLDLQKTQAERNRLGQFATPTELAQDILSYAKKLLPKRSKVRFFDPAIGTGSFFSALLSKFRESRIETAEGYEIDPHYAKPSKRIWRDSILNIRLADMISPKRSKMIALSRQVAMHLCREHTQASLIDIGDAFGRRDHSTVLHGCKKIAEKIKQEPDFARDIASINKQLQSS